MNNRNDMEEKLNRLYFECIKELNNIGIDISNEKQYGKIEISISKRNNKRYGCCKQEEPDRAYKTVVRNEYRRIIRYEKFKKHNIEISKWVMQLEDNMETAKKDITLRFDRANELNER